MKHPETVLILTSFWSANIPHIYANVSHIYECVHIRNYVVSIQGLGRVYTDACIYACGMLVRATHTQDHLYVHACTHHVHSYIRKNAYHTCIEGQA